MREQVRCRGFLPAGGPQRPRAPKPRPLRGAGRRSSGARPAPADTASAQAPPRGLVYMWPGPRLGLLKLRVLVPRGQPWRVQCGSPGNAVGLGGRGSGGEGTQGQDRVGSGEKPGWEVWARSPDWDHTRASLGDCCRLWPLSTSTDPCPRRFWPQWCPRVCHAAGQHSQCGGGNRCQSIRANEAVQPRAEGLP